MVGKHLRKKSAMCRLCCELEKTVAQLRFDVRIATVYNAEAPATRRGEIAPSRKRVADAVAAGQIHTTPPELATLMTQPMEWRPPVGRGRLSHTLTSTDPDDP